MQTRTKKTLAVGALGLAFAAAAAGSASAAAPTDALGSLGSAANLVPGTSGSALGAQAADTLGNSTLPANARNLLPSGNHLDAARINGAEIAPMPGLLGGLPLGR